MRAYSEDLRVRVLAAVDGGLPRAEAARRFGVSLPTIKRYLKLRRETGGLAPRPRPGQPSRKAAALRAGLLPQLEAHPDATLAEHCALWEATTGERVSPATVSRAIARLFGWTRKKSR
jgi:transposase